MAELFQIRVVFDRDKQLRPRSAWIVQDNTPDGWQPVMSARGRVRRFSTVEMALFWCREHRKGYTVHLDMSPIYTGVLYPSFT